jgi:hypothetical protein
MIYVGMIAKMCVLLLLLEIREKQSNRVCLKLWTKPEMLFTNYVFNSVFYRCKFWLHCKNNIKTCTYFFIFMLKTITLYVHSYNTKENEKNM